MGVRKTRQSISVGISWLDEATGENPLAGDTATVVAENEATGDVGEKAPIPNTGEASLAYAQDAGGTVDTVTVTDELGNEVSGEIEVD